MAPRQVLVAVSSAQLASGLVGQVVALGRQRPFDIIPLPLMQGRPEHVGRDSFWAGTALSAPLYMLALQSWATARLAFGPDHRAHVLLRWLATVMVPGYLVERLDRQRLTPGGFDPVETPIVVVGLTGAAAMAVIAARSQAGR
jgi:hypothetical protein